MARPDVCILIILMRLTSPSTVPELWASVNLLRTAWCSRPKRTHDWINGHQHVTRRLKRSGLAPVHRFQ